jgi:hypothetical protein
VLADLRKAARAMNKALAPVLDECMNPTAARLLLRMQMAESFLHPKDHYSQLLTWASYTAGLVDSALAPEVRKSRKRDERAHAWVRTAAHQWRAAGLPVTATGRFRAALAHYHAAGVPLVSDRDQIAAALKGQGQLRNANAHLK